MTYRAELIDQHELVYNWLQTFPLLVAAAPGGIYGPPGLPNGWTPATGKTVMYLGGSFSGNTFMTATENSYRFQCYGYDDVESRALWNVLYTHVHRATHQRVAITGGYGLLIYAQMVTGPNPQTDSNSGWTYNWGMFQITMAENFIS